MTSSPRSNRTTPGTASKEPIQETYSVEFNEVLKVNAELKAESREREVKKIVQRSGVVITYAVGGLLLLALIGYLISLVIRS